MVALDSLIASVRSAASSSQPRFNLGQHRHDSSQAVAERHVRHDLPHVLPRLFGGLTLEVIWAAAAALPPPQRPAFQERVAAELKSLTCGMIGPRTLHRIIAACQQTLLRAGTVAVGPSPKHGKSDVIRARARARAKAK
jgi:hypothetical protein